MTGTLDAALAYAELLGFSVFPVGPDCKVPRCEHGKDEATKDPSAIRALWRAATGVINVAVATGAPSGVFVLDVDCKGEVDGFAGLAELEARHGRLPMTWKSLTPSGGAHFWFRWWDGIAPCNRVGLKTYNADGTTREKFNGLDIRTTGGSAAVAPSSKPQGPYRWEVDPTDMEVADPPAWLVQMLEPLPRRKLDPVPINSTERAFRYVSAAIDGECGELARMGKATGRNLKLFQASANLGSLVGAGLLPESTACDALERAAEACGLLGEDGIYSVRATIKSGMGRGIANPREVRC
jgi:hypothetical protein